MLLLIHRKSIFYSYISLFYISGLIQLYIDFLLWVLCPERGLLAREQAGRGARGGCSALERAYLEKGESNFIETAKIPLN